MNTKSIVTIFQNILFVIGVILTIIGTSLTVTLVAKLVIFDSYPLNEYEENRCQYQNYPTRSVIEPGQQATATPEEAEAERQECLDQVEVLRKVRLVEHVSQAAVTLIAGIVLVYVFRRAVKLNN